MIILERCNECRNLMAIKDVEKENVWFVMEEQKMWKKICWPCRCKQGTDRHIEYINYAVEHGCGCM